MDMSETMELVRQAILLLLVVSLPVLLTALIVGLIVSVLQAATQVTDPELRAQNSRDAAGAGDHRPVDDRNDCGLQ
jgi:flagellar biosynthesis protein FlhB